MLYCEGMCSNVLINRKNNRERAPMEESGESINGFVKRAIDETIKRDSE